MDMDIDSPAPRKLRNKKSNPELMFIKRKPSDFDLSRSGAQIPVNTMTHSKPWVGSMKGVLDELSTEQVADVARSDLKNRGRRRSASPRRQAKHPREFRERHASQNTNNMLQAVQSVRNTALKEASPHDLDAWAEFMEKLSKTPPARANGKSHQLSSHLGPKPNRRTNVYRDDSSSNGAPQTPSEDDIDAAVLQFAHTRVNAEVSFVIRIVVHFHKDGESGDLLPPFGLDASEARSLKELVRHIENYEPYQMYISPKTTPSSMQLVHDSPSRRGICRRFVDLGDAIEDSCVEAEYGQFLERCEELGKHGATAVAEKTKLRRKDSKMKLRANKYELDGMKERDPKLYEVRESGAEVVAQVVLVF